jgi:hypothetical protein
MESQDLREQLAKRAKRVQLETLVQRAHKDRRIKEEPAQLEPLVKLETPATLERPEEPV